MSDLIQRMGKKLHDLVYQNRSKKRTLTPEEAQKARQDAAAALQHMNQNRAWAQIQVNAEIEMIRMLPAGDPRIQQHRRKLKLRLVMQQYVEKMAMTMEMVNSQIELGQMSAEMGTALDSANQLIRTYGRDMPSFTGFVRGFMKTVPAMNEALNGGLDEMSRALDQLCGSQVDSMFSEEDIDRLISGTATQIEPVVPIVTPARKATTADLLTSIEAELGSWKSQNS